MNNELALKLSNKEPIYFQVHNGLGGACIKCSTWVGQNQCKVKRLIFLEDIADLANEFKSH